jgi:probable rRNA maturation factor
MRVKIFKTTTSKIWTGSYAMPKVADMKSVICHTIKQACGSSFQDNVFSLSLVFVCREEIKKYNKEYRKVDAETDVLSFPEFDFSAMRWEDVMPFSKSCYLGDVMLSYERIVKDATEMSWRASDRVLHLIAHSVLHLLGFDHMEDDERDTMEGLEQKVMKKMGLPSPY